MDGSRLSQSSDSLPDVSLDMSPLLNAENTGPRRALQGAARYFRQAGARRSMREPSMLVRQSAAEQLEERQSDWAYSRPVVVLDLIWNLAFVIVATVILILSRHERPSTPLRIWIIGYALQCILHMICVCFEYHRRQLQRASARNLSSTSINAVDSAAESSTSLLQSENEIEGEGRSTGSNDEYDAGTENVSLAKRMESANTMFSFVWWIIGFYWITIGGQPLTHYAPHLYWLCIVFLAFDVFFVVFCVALACVIGIAVCCCLPCIIAILYAVADQEGASEEDINMIPKYKFRHSVCTNKRTDKLGGVMTLVGSSDTANERILSEEDAECCICLSPYDDGVELRELPCNHHFHCSCIDKWLRINATCPLCKFNIIHNNNDRHEEV